MSKTIRVGIIGCGQIAQHHLKQYATIPAEDVKVVAVTDINEACAKQTADKYAVGHVYTDFRKML
jgi:predicted dehydrogenase